MNTGPSSSLIGRRPESLTLPSVGTHRMSSLGHPPVVNVADLLRLGDQISVTIRQRGEDDDELVMAYESGRLGTEMPQGSIKAFRQYADFCSLSIPSIPVWPLTPVKVSLFLLFRILMGDVSHGTLLRDQYIRGLARSLEHYREDTARRFLPRWPEAAQLILRDGRGDPESRNDITHDILRICKQSHACGSLAQVIDISAVERLVSADNPNLSPDAWATRRRLSTRWVRDPETAKLPERQYTGGKFVGEPPKPPPLSGRSTHWNRHLHDLRGGKAETSWVRSPKSPGTGGPWTSARSSSDMELDVNSMHPESTCTAGSEQGYEEDMAAVTEREQEQDWARGRRFDHAENPGFAFESLSSLPTPLSGSLDFQQSDSMPPLSASSSSYRTSNTNPSDHSLSLLYSPGASSSSHDGSNKTKPFGRRGDACSLPSLTDVGLHPSSFPHTPPPTAGFSSPHAMSFSGTRGVLTPPPSAESPSFGRRSDWTASMSSPTATRSQKF